MSADAVELQTYDNLERGDDQFYAAAACDNHVVVFKAVWVETRSYSSTLKAASQVITVVIALAMPVIAVVWYQAYV